MSKHVLFLRMEPTSYTRALVRDTSKAWSGTVDTVYVGNAITQPWVFDAPEDAADFLPAGRMSAASAIVARIYESKPDLVHTAGWGAAPCAAALLAARSQGIKTVVDLDTWQDAVTGWRAGLKRLILPHILNNVSHFAPGGQRQAAFLERYGVPPSRITPINMTVDVAEIRRAIAANPDAKSDFRLRHRLGDGPVVLFLGRLIVEKGVEDILAAWRVVSPRFPRARLVVAGDGPLSKLLVDRAEADPSVRPIGRIAGDDVWRAYAAADLYVAPSWRDGWGLTINEAMAAGVAILMTDAFGCIGDLVTPGTTAEVVPFGDPPRLAESMLKLLDNPAARCRLAECATMRINEWTMQHQANRLTSIWSALLS